MPHRNPEPVSILLAEDDDDDYLLTEQALKQTNLSLHRVADGVELMDFLHARGSYAAPRPCPPPSLLLLDLNMPRKDGREALREIKSDPALRCLPVVVLTTSRADEDVLRSYQLGVNSFITKPVTFPALASAMRVLAHYWFQLVQLPRSQPCPAPEGPLLPV